MNKQLEFNIEPQINGYSCLAASMNGIIYFLKEKKVEQKEIFNVGHDAESGFRSYIGKQTKQPIEGIGSTGVIAISKAFGLKGIITKRGNFDKLKFFINKDLPILVNYQCNPDALGQSGHYGVIIGIQNEDVLLADPRRGIENPIEPLAYSKFEKFWYDPCLSSGKWMASFWPENKKVSLPFRGLLI
jgi:hypothetical protein